MEMSTRTTTLTIIELSLAEVSDLVRRGLRQKGHIDIPENMELKVHVPGGGDWSNTALTVADCTITYERTS